MTPIDIIITAVENPGFFAPRNGHKESDAEWAARVVRHMLTDDRIVANAVEALKADGWTHTHEGPGGIGELSDEDLSAIAATVLRSVGGGQ